MNKKFIFMDIDNTLLDHDIGIPNTAIEAIKQARDNEHKVFICTGRASSDMDPNIRQLDFDGYIYSCGANIQIDGKSLFTKTFEKEDVIQILNLLNQVDVAFNLEGLHESFLNPAGWQAFCHIIQKEFPTSQEAQQYMHSINMFPLSELSEEKLEQISKICIFQHCDSFQKEIVDKLPSTFTYTEHDLGTTYLFGEISLKHINKATGIEKVLQHFKASISDTIAFGDSMNDYSMIQSCDIGVCVGNGEESIKKIADYVCPNIKDDGIYLAFKHLKLIGSKSNVGVNPKNEVKR